MSIKTRPNAAYFSFVCFSVLAVPGGHTALAQELDTGDQANDVLITTTAGAPDEVFTIVGTAAEADALGGSAEYLDEEFLEQNNYADINRILRAVPGVNIQEEDGFGLRPNIGLRGTGVDRSDNISLMEDGVLIAPAPYASPSAYYFPRAGRMSGIEVTKGAASIVYGPMTTGGALHMISTPVPNGFEARLETMVGEYGRRQIHATIGTMEDVTDGVRAGFLLETFQDQSDGFKELAAGDTGFDIDDYVGRFRLEVDQLLGFDQSFEIKLQFSEEQSDETYLGLTQGDYDANPYMRYAGSQVDQMNNEHGIAQFTHSIWFNDDVRLLTTAYRTEFQRNWFKLNKVDDPIEGNTSISSILDDPTMYAGALEILRGADGFTSADDALEVKANNRTYFAQGIQTTLQWDWQSNAVDHHFEASARYHEDEMDRFQWVDGFAMDNGTMVRTSHGVPGTDSNRIDSAEAWAFFLRDEISFGDWTVTPGIRYEMIDTFRDDYGNADPTRTGVSLTHRTNSVNVFIPGISATYDLNDEFMLLAGVHRGFTPPGPGSSSDAEESTNWEAGFRWFGDLATAELIGFYSDYENLVGSCTASTGGNCTIGDTFDGGEVSVLGVEAQVAADFDTPWAGVTAPVSIAYTFTQAEFDTSFNSGFGPWSTVNEGDELPYLPEHQFTLMAGLEGEHGDNAWRVGLTTNYVSEARATAGSGSIAASDRIDNRWVTDVSAAYEFVPGAELYLRVDNIMDEKYVTARRPAGLRPGMPRTAMVGLRVSFEQLGGLFN